MNIFEEIFQWPGWMPPAHCLRPLWVRLIFIFSGVGIGILYGVFYDQLRRMRAVLQKLIHQHFPQTLGRVFVLCAICHTAHGLGYWNQYVKTILIFAYPTLFFYQLRLIYVSQKAKAVFRKLKSVAEIEKILKENENLKERNTALYSAAVKGYAARNWGMIEDAIKAA